MSPPTATADDRRQRRAFGWTLADQAVSSATNAGVAFAAAGHLPAAAFGGYGLATTLGLTAIGVARSVATDPLVVGYAGTGVAHFIPARDSALSTALACAIALGAVTVLGALTTGAATRLPLLALAAVLPGVVVQDALRGVFFAERRPRRALACDAGWAAVAAAIVVVMPAERSGAAWVLAWGAGAYAAVLGTLLALRPRPRMRPSSSLGWLRSQQRLAGPSALNFALANGSVQVVTLCTGAIAGLGAIGAVRGAAVALGPLGVLVTAMMFTVSPHAAVLARRAPSRLVRAVAIPSAAVAVVCVAVGAGALLVPDGLGSWLLGDTWPDARPALLPQGLVFAALAAEMGALVCLRTVGRIRTALRVQIAAAPLAVTAGIIGAMSAGAAGALWGVGLCRLALLPLWWLPILWRPVSPEATSTSRPALQEDPWPQRTPSP